MNALFLSFLSMSASGGLLILALFLGQRLWKGKISRQWQYYIWLVVILRLLLPFGPEATLLGEAHRAVGRAAAQTALAPRRQSPPPAPEDRPAPAGGKAPDGEAAPPPAADGTAVRPLQGIGALLIDHLWLIWLAAALGLLLYKAAMYRSFVRYIRAGSVPVSDVGMLDRLSALARKKVDAVRRDDLMALDEVMKQEQAMTLNLRGLELKRLKLMGRLGLDGVPLDELEGRCPPELAGRARSAVDALRSSYTIYRSCADMARSLLELNLHQIEKVIAASGVDPAVAASGYEAPGVEPPKQMKTDFRA